jgi:hypothetical protein
MASVINGGIGSHVRSAGESALGDREITRGIVDAHALGGRAGSLVPIIGLNDIRTDCHALILGAGVHLRRLGAGEV